MKINWTKFGSRKFLGAVVTAVGAVVAASQGQLEWTEAFMAVVTVVGIYIGGEAYVDGKRVEGVTLPLIEGKYPSDIVSTEHIGEVG